MKKGFTLSEVLITLGIIGVVAALTLPSIIQQYRNKLCTAQLKRIYSEIQDGINSVITDEHSQNFYETTAGVESAVESEDFPEGKGVYYFFQKYFKPIKSDCKSTCVASSYSSLDGSSSAKLPEDIYCIQLATGASLCGFYADDVTTFYVDVNGSADPNIACRDMFGFSVSGKILNDNPQDNSEDDTEENNDEENSEPSGSLATLTQGCVTNIIDAGWKMNY